MLLLLVLLAGALVGIINLPPVTRALGRHFAELASEKTGMGVRCGAARILPTGLRLTDLGIDRNGQPAIAFRELTLSPDLHELLSGRIALEAVHGDGFTVFLPAADQPVSDRDGAKPAGEASSSGSRRDRIARLLDPAGFELELSDGQVRWGDPRSPRVKLPLESIQVFWPRPGQFPIRGDVRIAPVAGEGGLTVEAETLGEAAGVKARIHGPGVPLEAFWDGRAALLPASMVEKLEKLREKVPHLPTVGGDFTAEFDGRARTLGVQGRIVAAGLEVEDERLAKVAVGPLELSQDVALAVYLEGRRLVIDRWDGQVNRARYQFHGSVEPTPDGTLVNATAELNQTPYQDLIDSLPPSVIVPAMEGVRIGGRLELRASVNGNLSDLADLNTEFSANFGQIRLEQPSKPLQGPEPLQGFVYHPVSRDGVPREFVLGRGQPGWVTIDQLPKHLIYSLLLSEDITFYQHEGFDPEGLKKALKDNLKAGRAVRGGSTITQQLAKNLFLKREKTAIRKLQEAVLAWELEQVLKKQQILEFYFNIIEWGPGIYGIGRAAQHYFGKHPSELSVKEGAFLCTIIPNPIRYYMYFQRGELTERWNEHVQALLDRMRAFEHLDEEEYQIASEEVLAFRGSPRAAVDVNQMEAEDAAEQAAEQRGGAGEGEHHLTQPVEPVLKE